MSGSFYGFNAAGGIVSPSVLLALAAIGVPTPPSILNATSGSVAVQSFVNGAATLTRGVDFVATYAMDYGAFGHVDYSLAANYTNTGLNSINKPPSNVNQAVQLLDQTAIGDMTTASPKYRFALAGYWTKGPWSLNVRENVYGASYQWQQNDATGDYQKIPIDANATTDFEIGYEVIHGVKLFAGANNAFNTFPTKEPLSYRQAQFNANDNGYAASLYPGNSPFGVNGGYYYGRITWSF
jgi:iron complex outermembrane receptor protein